MPSALDAAARLEHNRQRASALVNRVLLLLALPVGVLGVLLVLVTRAWVLLLAVVVVVAALLGAAASAMRSHGDRLLAALAASPASAHDHARLQNLVEGLVVTHGLASPALYVVDAASANAGTVTLRSRQPALLVTRGLLDVLERIELEGALAQQLCQVRDGATSLGTLVAGVADGALFAPVRPLLGGALSGALDPEGVQQADLAAVELTRYPPGLAGALDRLAGLDTSVPAVRPSAAQLWLADPLPAGGPAPLLPHPPVGTRVAVLREL